MKHIFKSPPNTKFGSIVREVEHVIDRYGIFNGKETNTRGFFYKKTYLFFIFFLFSLRN